MQNNLSVGQVILELRKAKGATQEELATAVGISPQAISKWENGGSPDIELLPAVAGYFNVPVDRLFGRTTHPNLSEAVEKYIKEAGQFKGFDRAFSIYTALHKGVSDSKTDEMNNAAYHYWCENGCSILTPNGYGSIVTREFWESVNLDTAVFARDLFALLAEPGMLEVIFAMLRRKHDGPANFQMLKTALVNANVSDEHIQSCLDKLAERKMIYTENSPYDEIGKVYGFKPEYGPGHWYLGLCALICAAQTLKMGSNRSFFGLGEWPVKL